MKVLVTRAAGKLGSVVCAHLIEHGHQVRATDYKHRADLGTELPALVSEQSLDRYTAAGNPAPPSAFNFGEALAYLMFSDAAELVRLALANQQPGYHQYFPAQTPEVQDVPVPALIGEFYSGVPLRRAREQIDALVDISAIAAALGWVPRQRATIQLSDERV